MKEISHGELMRSIRDSILPYVAADDAEELAFHLMEIISEIDVLKQIADSAAQGEPVQSELVFEAIDRISSHWPYHQRKLKKRARRLRLDEINRPDAGEK